MHTNKIILNNKGYSDYLAHKTLTEQEGKSALTTNTHSTIRLHFYFYQIYSRLCLIQSWQNYFAKILNAKRSLIWARCPLTDIIATVR